MNSKKLLPNLGFGLGLRQPHIDEILAGAAQHSKWFEIISENYLGQVTGGFSPSFKTLEKIRANYPVVMHGVSMNIGSQDAINFDYLKKLKELRRAIDASWISDHLCWTGLNKRNVHDLLPLPYTQEAITHCAERLLRIQDFLGEAILIENVSSYVHFPEAEMDEADFLKEVCLKSGCFLLCDLNNIFVTSYNHKLDANQYLKKIPWDRVVQIHLAGPRDKGDYMIDTHDEPVRPEVWDLLRWVRDHGVTASIMIEWDDNIPPLSVVEEELLKAKNIFLEHKAEARYGA